MKENNIEHIHHFFGNTTLLSLDCLDLEDMNDQRKRYGFDRIKIGNGFFYNNDELPFFEISIYLRKSDSIQICELWDDGQELFCFYTKNKIETFKLIKEYISIAKDLTIIESNLKKLHKEDEE